MATGATRFDWRILAVLAALLFWTAGGDASAADPTEPAARTWPPKGQKVKVKVTRDTWISTVGDERYTSGGGDSRFKIKGQQEYGLMDIDASALKGKIITGALLHLHSASPAEAPIVRTTVSTVSSPWVEGSGKDYQRQEGSSCYVQAELGKRDWSYPGSTYMDVAFGRGNTLWRFADPAPPDAAGFQALAVSPDVVAARAAGLSYGFGLYDDVGNIWSYKGGKFTFTYFPNRFVHARESGRFAPYMEVWTNGTDSAAPGPVGDVKVRTAGLPAGEAMVTWVTPADKGGGRTLGFNVAYEAGGKKAAMPRYLIPMAGAVGGVVRMHVQDLPLGPGETVKLSIAAVDSAGNVGEAVTEAVEVSASPRVFKIAASGVEPFAPSEKLPEVGGLKVAVVDLTDKVHPTRNTMQPKQPKGYLGGNHLWSAARRLVRLHSARNEAVCFQVNLAGASKRAELKLAFATAGIKARVYRLDCVKTRIGNVPDVCVPVTGAFAVPFADDPQSAGASNVSLLCEVYVPHKAAAGSHAGTLTVASGGGSLDIKVDLTVWDFTLPDKLSFVPEMNAYSGVTPVGGGLKYYRLAHEHRLCLNRLYYGWSGSVNMAPKWTGSRLEFDQWDRQFGPLLDGSAFKDLPRSGEPVDMFYLPFNENWPADVFAGFKKSYWADEAFTPGYKATLKKAFADMAAHCDRKKWHDTVFQCYLNNKVYYKKDVGWRRSAAPWIFDEPVGTQDFWALRWYGMLWHQAVAPVKGKAKMWYRCDISYSQFGRNLMWGVMDLVYFGGSNSQKVRMKRDEQMLWGPSHFCEYGSANDPGDPNVQPVVWSLKAWSRGAIGVLPWQTIGSAGNMASGTGTGLFIPHGGGVVPSVRLKAFRRGQQDVEYLTLLGDVYDKPIYAVAGGMRQIVSLAGKVLKTSETDAGTIRFDKASPAALWLLRTSAGRMLSAKKPPYRRVVRDIPSAPMDMRRLPDIGYVRVAPKVKAPAPDMD